MTEDQIARLEGEVVELMHEVERQRVAAEDALQQLDWCIGYFTGQGQRGIASSLGRSRSVIRSHLMQRDEQPMPPAE